MKYMAIRYFLLARHKESVLIRAEIIDPWLESAIRNLSYGTVVLLSSGRDDNAIDEEYRAHVMGLIQNAYASLSTGGYHVAWITPAKDIFRWVTYNDLETLLSNTTATLSFLERIDNEAIVAYVYR
jgi:hypothetical protein